MTMTSKQLESEVDRLLKMAEKLSVRIGTLQQTAYIMGRALRVIALTPHIREYLEKYDPMALKQVREAIAPQLDRLGKRVGGNL